jgi:hypothetical protein
MKAIKYGEIITLACIREETVALEIALQTILLIVEEGDYPGFYEQWKQLYNELQTIRVMINE